MIFCAFIALLLGCKSSNDESVSSSKIIVIPEISDVGNKIGEHVEVEIYVENRGQEFRRIDLFKTSCECLEVAPRTLSLDPNSREKVRLKLDSSKLADFTGILSIRVEGVEQGRVLFLTILKVEIR